MSITEIYLEPSVECELIHHADIAALKRLVEKSSSPDLQMLARVVLRELERKVSGGAVSTPLPSRNHP